jgi:hypothetical protein
LKLGREVMICSLGMRMYQLATTDGLHTFQACASLLRTFGGPMRRVPKDRDDDDVPAADEPDTVRIVLPHNFREPPPPDAIIAEPPEIEAEAES